MNLDGLPYVVAPMQLADVPVVAQIEQIVFTLPWSATAFGHELRHNRASEYLVLRYQPRIKPGLGQALARRVGHLLRRSSRDRFILGYGGFWITSQEAHICTLAVRPEWRGRGLGELLLVSLVERALERQARVVTLEVRASNGTAQKLYEKHGFQQVGRRKRYYSDNGEDALVMTTPPMLSAEYRRRFVRLCSVLRNRLVHAAQGA